MKPSTIGILTIMALCIDGSMEDRLVIIPNGDVIGHLTRPLMFLCAQPNGLNATFDWFINETNIRNLDFFFSTKNGPYSSKLHFRQLMVSLNNSMIRCEGVLEDENRQFSPSTTLMIQGYLPEVELNEVITYDHNISITWNRPFTLDPNEDIHYIIKMTNHTLNENNITYTSDTKYWITSNSTRRMACDSFTFTIIPVNIVGNGTVKIITNIFRAATSVEHEVVSHEGQKANLIITLKSAICEIRIIEFKNVYMNETHQLDHFDYHLTDSTFDSYKYFLNVNIAKRFIYTLEMTVNNSNGSNSAIFNISTFTVKSVAIGAEQSGIGVDIDMFSYASDDVGVFISLLPCATDLCERIDYNKSVYISTYNKKNSSYFVEFNRGFYLLSAFETDLNGTLLASYNNTCLPILEDVQFFSNHILTANSSIKSTYCEMDYSRNVVRSKCNCTSLNSEKQLLLLSKTSNNITSLNVSNPGSNNTLCLSYDDEFLVAITNQISNSSEDQSNQPIGLSVFSPSLNVTGIKNNEFCAPDSLPSVPPTLLPNDDDRYGIIVSILVIASCSCIIAFLLVILFHWLRFKRRGKKKTN